MPVCRLSYSAGGKAVAAAFVPDDGWEDGAVAVKPSVRTRADGVELTFRLAARRPVTLLGFTLVDAMPAWADNATGTFVNGFQSWSRSEELLPRQEQRDLRRPLFFLRPYAEPKLAYGAGCGRFHSWSYTYLRSPARTLLLGSTAERSGFTWFEIDWPAREMRAHKDCRGRVLAAGEEYTLLGLYTGQGSSPAELFTAYARACGLQPAARERLTGWLSWYYYYTRVGAADIRAALAGLRDLDLPLDFVMIDDGYEAAVGDWLTPNGRFPEGMAPLAGEIRAAGFRPGLWVAPFVAERRAAIFRDHPDWFLREPGGRLVKAGYNTNWSGTFYALDLQNPEAREYAADTVRTMTAAWGFDLLKVDFIYAACLRPTPRRTRGELMAEAVDLLANASGAPLLGCGVPLGSAWGRFRFCRIGADTAPYWTDRKLAWGRYRERVATENALASIMGRFYLDKRFFAGDPDAFFLRRQACRLTPVQKRTLFLLTYLCGSVFAFSDPPALLGPEERALLRRAFPIASPEVAEQRQRGKLHELWLACGGDPFLVLANLGGGREIWPVPESLRGALLFDQMEGEIAADGTGTKPIVMAPYQTRLLKITPPGREMAVIGTSLHLLGGKADVERIDWGENGLRAVLRPGVPAAGRVWAAVPLSCASDRCANDRALRVPDGRFVAVAETGRGAISPHQPADL